MVNAQPLHHWFKSNKKSLIENIVRCNYEDIVIPGYGVYNPELIDPVSLREWDRTWGKKVIDIAMIKNHSSVVSSEENHDDNEYLLPWYVFNVLWLKFLEISGICCKLTKTIQYNR